MHTKNVKSVEQKLVFGLEEETENRFHIFNVNILIQELRKTLIVIYSSINLYHSSDISIKAAAVTLSYATTHCFLGGK